MCHPAALYLAVLFSTTLVDSQSTCVSDAPDNCTFASGLSACRWPFESNGWVNERSSAAFGASGSSEANVTSRTACRTGQETHCLQIRYLFDERNAGIRVLLIRVRDDDDGDDSRELVAWNGADAGIGAWYNASIPIQSKDNFNITVEARKFTQVVGHILINSIHYIKAPCLHLPTSTVPSPLTNTQEERTTTIGSHVSSDTSSTVPSPATRTQEERTTAIGSHVSADKQANRVGVVVGVVMAVVVAVVVAVVILVLYRRKRLHLWMTCFRNSKRTDTAVTSTSRNTVETLGNNDTVAPTGVIANSGHDDQSVYLTPISHEYTYITASPNTESGSRNVNQHAYPTPNAHSGVRDTCISTADQSLYLTLISDADAGISTGQHATSTGTNYVNQQLYTTPGARSPDNDYSVLGNTAGSDATLPSNPYVNQTMRADNQNSHETLKRTSDDPYEVV